MIGSRAAVFVAIASTLMLTPAFAQAQTATTGLTARPASKPPAVTYLYPEQISLQAGKATTVALHFRIAPGLHINSHNPRAEELIPTTLSIPEGSGVRLESAIYPSGVDFALPIDPSTKLNVYTGEFAIKARVVATAGNHLVEARLRYQACDDNACMPPKTITAAIDVIGN